LLILAHDYIPDYVRCSKSNGRGEIPGPSGHIVVWRSRGVDTAKLPAHGEQVA
jgi:hypothetical protein